MSWQSETRAWAMASAVAFSLGAIGYRVLTLPKLPDVAPIVAHIDVATGAWAKASDQQVRSVAAIERDLRAQMWHVDRTLTTVDGTLRTAQGTLAVTGRQIERIGPLLDSARGATEQIGPLLNQAQVSVASIPPAVTDFREFMQRPDLLETLSNVQAMTRSGAGIVEDGRLVADKAKNDFLKPVPWYLWPVKKGSQLIDIGAAIARHTP